MEDSIPEFLIFCRRYAEILYPDKLGNFYNHEGERVSMDWVFTPYPDEFMRYIKVEYVGLKDADGEPIYEHDILDFDEEEWGTKVNDEEIIKSKLIDWQFIGTVSDVNKFRRVIGNALTGKRREKIC